MVSLDIRFATFVILFDIIMLGFAVEIGDNYDFQSSGDIDVYATNSSYTYPNGTIISDDDLISDTKTSIFQLFFFMSGFGLTAVGIPWIVALIVGTYQTVVHLWMMVNLVNWVRELIGLT